MRHGSPMSPEWFSLCSESVTSGGCEKTERNNECWVIEVIGQDWSSEVVALFLEDWELGRVALSCHTATDLLCQETRHECWVRSESPGTSFAVITVPMKFSCGAVTATKVFLSLWTGCDLLSWVCLSVSPNLMQLKHGESWERGRPFPFQCHFRASSLEVKRRKCTSWRSLMTSGELVEHKRSSMGSCHCRYGATSPASQIIVK